MQTTVGFNRAAKDGHVEHLNKLFSMTALHRSDPGTVSAAVQLLDLPEACMFHFLCATL